MSNFGDLDATTPATADQDADYQSRHILNEVIRSLLWQNSLIGRLLVGHEELREEIEALKAAFLAMQPRYHTFFHTFKNEAEADLAWHCVHWLLYPGKPVPPMPVGEAFTNPYVESKRRPTVSSRNADRKGGAAGPEVSV